LNKRKTAKNNTEATRKVLLYSIQGHKFSHYIVPFSMRLNFLQKRYIMTVVTILAKCDSLSHKTNVSIMWRKINRQIVIRVAKKSFKILRPILRHRHHENISKANPTKYSNLLARD
jgi:dynactin complex subunit